MKIEETPRQDDHAEFLLKTQKWTKRCPYDVDFFFSEEKEHRGKLYFSEKTCFWKSKILPVLVFRQRDGLNIVTVFHNVNSIFPRYLSRKIKNNYFKGFSDFFFRYFFRFMLFFSNYKNPKQVEFLFGFWLEIILHVPTKSRLSRQFFV